MAVAVLAVALVWQMRLLRATRRLLRRILFTRRMKSNETIHVDGEHRDRKHTHPDGRVQ